MYNLETRLQTQNQREYRERILSAYQVRIFLSIHFFKKNALLHYNQNVYTY